MVKVINVAKTIWGFYEAFEADDKDSMAGYFETMYHHYKQRGKKIRQLRGGDD